VTQTQIVVNHETSVQCELLVDTILVAQMRFSLNGLYMPKEPR